MRANKSMLNTIEICCLSRSYNPHATFQLISWKQNMKAVRIRRVSVVKYLKKLTSVLKNTPRSRVRRRQPGSSFTIDDYRQIIVDTNCLQKTARCIFVVLIGSKVYSIITFFQKTQTMAIVIAAQAQSRYSHKNHIKVER